jgi:hypothetical protein
MAGHQTGTMGNRVPFAIDEAKVAGYQSAHDGCFLKPKTSCTSLQVEEGASMPAHLQSWLSNAGLVADSTLHKLRSSSSTWRQKVVME